MVPVRDTEPSISSALKIFWYPIRTPDQTGSSAARFQHAIHFTERAFQIVVMEDVEQAVLSRNVYCFAFDRQIERVAFAQIDEIRFEPGVLWFGFLEVARACSIISSTTSRPMMAPRFRLKFRWKRGAIIGLDVVDEMMQACARNLKEAEQQNAWFKSDFVDLRKGNALDLPIESEA